MTLDIAALRAAAERARTGRGKYDYLEGCEVSADIETLVDGVEALLKERERYRKALELSAETCETCYQMARAALAGEGKGE